MLNAIYYIKVIFILLFLSQLSKLTINLSKKTFTIQSKIIMTDKSANLILYSTLDCQLCEAVEDRLKAEKIAYQYVDIIHDDTLMDDYGWFIPVLKWQEEIYKSPLELDKIIPKIQQDLLNE